MFYIWKKKGGFDLSFDFTRGTVDYKVRGNSVRKYNYKKRDKNNLALTEPATEDELREIINTLLKLMYEQNKAVAKTAIRGLV
jgi:hypothetical protein